MSLRLTYNTFTQGQISRVDSGTPTAKAIEGRTGLELYQAGLRECTNFLPLVQGPLLTRPPFQLVAPAAGGIKIVTFEFNATQVYVFVFTDLSLTIYRDDVQVATVTTPWSAAQLQKMKGCQGGDTFIGLHPAVPPTKIVRSGSDSSWVCGSIAFTNPPNHDFGSGSEPAWSATRGYPSCGNLHQNRLCLANTPQLPSTLWGSLTSSPFDFSQATGSGGVAIASDAFEFTLQAGAIASIQDIFSVNDNLVINTSLSEITESSLPLDATSVKFSMSSRHGMLDTGIRSSGIDTASLFVDRQSNLRAFSYDYASNAFISKNLNVLTPGLLNAPTRSAYLRNCASSNLFWVRRGDGTLACLTIDLSQQVTGWSIHKLFSGSFRDIAVLGKDQPVLYSLIDYNGSTWLAKLDPLSPYLLDLYSAGSSATAKAAWTGFTTYANQTVTVIGDGVAFTNVSVDGSGAFTLTDAVKSVSVGIQYKPVAETLPMNIMLQGQQMRGRRIRKVRADISLRNTASIYLDGRRVELRKLNAALLNQPMPAQDVAKTVTLSGVGPEPTVKFEARDPFSAMLVMATIEFKTAFPEPGSGYPRAQASRRPRKMPSGSSSITHARSIRTRFIGWASTVMNTSPRSWAVVVR